MALTGSLSNRFHFRDRRGRRLGMASVAITRGAACPRRVSMDRQDQARWIKTVPVGMTRLKTGTPGRICGLDPRERAQQRLAGLPHELQAGSGAADGGVDFPTNGGDDIPADGGLTAIAPNSNAEIIAGYSGITSGDSLGDQRPFLHPDPSDSQLHDGASSLQFTSLIFYRVQARGQEWP